MWDQHIAHIFIKTTWAESDISRLQLHTHLIKFPCLHKSKIHIKWLVHGREQIFMAYINHRPNLFLTCCNWESFHWLADTAAWNDLVSSHLVAKTNKDRSANAAGSVRAPAPCLGLFLPLTVPALFLALTQQQNVTYWIHSILLSATLGFYNPLHLKQNF